MFFILPILLFYASSSQIECSSSVRLERNVNIVSTRSLRSLYNSLDPNSISQHLAFYELYENSSEGKRALQDLYRLLTRGSPFSENIPLQTSLSDALHSIVSLVNKTSTDPLNELSEEELNVIDKLASNLPNRQLKGYGVLNEEEILLLEPSEIELSRGVLLSQLGNSKEAIRKIRSYEATIDLMALQILSHLSTDASPRNKIREINRLIFEEIGFRFPPHSTYSKDVDLYTFLPSVLDSRRGVCLGVSLLYLSLAQRLNLNLEIVTPPGHIFVRFREKGETINIETTARGVHIPDTEYLGVDTRNLQQRNIKETIGMAHFNQAAVFWERQEYDKALASYTIAERYLPEDKHLLELKGCCALVQDKTALGKELLESVADYLPHYAVSKHTIAADYLSSAVGTDGIKSLFIHVDQTRESLLGKKNALEKVIEKYPKFREGLFSLAGTWLQLHRTREAVEILKRYHELDSENATVEYYLATLYAERIDYNNAWKHLKIAEALAEKRNHYPKILTDMRKQLSYICPE
jgi:tetratricopeptide (TPR) repeat protein